MRAQGRTEMKPYEAKKLGPKPDHRPDTSEAIRVCVNAWYELDADRKIGMAGAGAIPFTALVTWAEVNRLDRENFDVLRHVIRYLDNERTIREDAARKAKGKKR